MVKRYIMYRKARILVDAPRPERCEACGRGRDVLKQIDTHHWKYAYTTAEVRAKPELVLENTVALCYPCHRAADAIRKLDEFDADGRVWALIESKKKAARV